MKIRVLAILLALALVAALMPVTLAVSHPFADVPESAWYAEYVEYVYEHGLMVGTSGTTFEPEETMNRAMVVKVLHNSAGKPGHSGQNPFVDVSKQRYYSDAVLWAVEQKIAIGTTTTTFEPETEINREMLVTFLYRYARFLELDLSEGDLSGYVDREEISGYARSAFAWAVKQGIVKGTDLTHLSPKDTATRAECATVLTRFDRWNEENAESKPTEPEDEKKNPADVTYEEYLAMSRKEQVAHMESFESVEAFFEWYHAAKEKYEEEHPDIEIGDGGDVDLGGGD